MVSALLPRKTRLHLWWQHQVDAVCISLCHHDHDKVAEAIWRLCGMW